MREKCSETRTGDSQVINTILPTVICICQPSVTDHWSNIFKIVRLPFKHMPSRLLRHTHGVEDNTKDYNVGLSRTLLLLLLVNKMRTFKVCKSVHHRTIQINHQPDATIFQFIILTFIYSSTCFGCFPAHHQELNDCSDSLRFYLFS